MNDRMTAVGVIAQFWCLVFDAGVVWCCCVYWSGGVSIYLFLGET